MERGRPMAGANPGEEKAPEVGERPGLSSPTERPGRRENNMLKITSARFVRSVGRLGDIPRDGKPQVAFAGRSNVGKSALINYLVNRRKLAGISKSPGKTRMLNFYLINDRLYFVDLPGYGFAKVAGPVRRVWVNLIDEYLAGSNELRLVVWLLDVRRQPSREDQEMSRLLQETCIPVIVAVTKCDKVSRGKLQGHLDRIRSNLGLATAVPLIPTSTEKRLGRQRLLGVIGDRTRGKTAC
jgi:GTP-binding protein